MLSALVLYFNRGLPSAEELLNINAESTRIFDREENLLYTVYGSENRVELASLDQISPYLIDATLAVEDDQFYEHNGLDYPAIFKAVMYKFFGIGSPRGGSTLTQQLVKNAFLSPEQTLERKIKEAILAVKVEMRFTKDEILLFYFNTISYGGTAYGIATSSEMFFGKEAKDLTLGESAVMAGIVNSPTWYSPYGENRNSHLASETSTADLADRGVETYEDLGEDEWVFGLIGGYVDLGGGNTLYLPGRTDTVLSRMEQLGYITEAQQQSALSELQTLQFQEIQEDITYPHFVFYVISELEEMYGPEFVAQGGLQVYTTLDPTMQAEAEATIADYYNSGFIASGGANNAAMLVSNPKTGQILAMVGSVDFYNTEIDGQVNLTTSPRQPGSSFKPFIYAAMILKGYGAGTVLYDIPISYGNYKPNNYEGGFYGPVTMRQALGKSRNTAAIQAYYIAGEEEELVPFLQKFGFDIQEGMGYGAPMALGTISVPMIDMVEGYGVFANYGVHVPLSPFLKITNADGEVLYQWNEMDLDEELIIDPQAAYIINDILSDSSAGFGPYTHLYSLNNAAKTGTSTDGVRTDLPNDLWCIAYTPNIVAAVWTGNTDDSPLYLYASGYTISAPILQDFLIKVEDQIAATEWPVPDGISSVTVSKTSGLLPTTGAATVTDIFPSFGVPTEYDAYGYQTVKIETISNKLATEYSPEEFVTTKTYQSYHTQFAEEFPEWQKAIEAYYGTSGVGAPSEEATDIHNAETAANAPSPSSISVSGEVAAGSTVTVSVDTTSGNGLDHTVFTVNGGASYIANGTSGSVRIPLNASKGSTIEICAKVYDVYGYSGSTCNSVTVTAEGSNDDDDEEEEDEEEDD